MWRKEREREREREYVCVCVRERERERKREEGGEMRVGCQTKKEARARGTSRVGNIIR